VRGERTEDAGREGLAQVGRSAARGGGPDQGPVGEDGDGVVEGFDCGCGEGSVGCGRARIEMK
jgi:hypothetical protein